jgi:carbonic anhydrase
VIGKPSRGLTTKCSFAMIPLLSFIFLLAAPLALGNCLYGTSQFPQDASILGEWGYAADNGPLTWAKLSMNNSLCGSGRNQSPIDIGQ